MKPTTHSQQNMVLAIATTKMSMSNPFLKLQIFNQFSVSGHFALNQNEKLFFLAVLQRNKSFYLIMSWGLVYLKGSKDQTAHGGEDIWITLLGKDRQNLQQGISSSGEAI